MSSAEVPPVIDNARTAAPRRKRAAMPAWILRALFAIVAFPLLWMGYSKSVNFRAPVFYDEAYNILEARWVAGSVKLAAGYAGAKLTGDAPPLRDYVRAHGGRPFGYYPSYGKPVHTLILAVGILAADGENWGAFAAMGCCAALGIVALFFWARRIVGDISAYYGALLLAMTAYWALYAQEALAESDSVALMILGLWATTAAAQRIARHQALSAEVRRGTGALAGHFRLLPRHRIFLLLAGSLFGLSFAANYRWFWLPLIGFLALATAPRRFSPRAFLSQSTWFSLGMALPLILAELPGLALRAYYHRIHLPPPFETYFEQLARLYFFHTTSDKGFDFDALAVYPYLLFKWTSPLFCALVLVGAITLLRRARHRRRALLLLAPPAVMLGFYALYTYNFARFATLSLPFLGALAGVGVMAIGHRASVSLSRVWKPPQWVSLAASARFLILLLAVPSQFRPTSKSLLPPRFDMTWRIAVIPAVSLNSTYKTVVLTSEVHLVRASLPPAARNVRVLQIPPGTRTIDDLNRLAAAAAPDATITVVLAGALADYWGPTPVFDELRRQQKPFLSLPDPRTRHIQFDFEHARDFKSAYSGSIFPRATSIEGWHLPGPASKHSPPPAGPDTAPTHP